MWQVVSGSATLSQAIGVGKQWPAIYPRAIAD